MNLKNYGWLTTAVCVSLALSLSACRTKTKNQNHANHCAPEVESLSISLGEQVDRFMEALQRYERRQIQANELRRTAHKTVQLCEEFRSYQTQWSCVSRDQFSGQDIQIQRDLHIDECNLASQHSGHVTTPPHQPPQNNRHWADEEIDQFRPESLMLSIKDHRTLDRAVRNSQAFLKGKSVDLRTASQASQRGEVSCAVQVRQGRLNQDEDLIVKQINPRRERGQQSFTLVAETRGLRLLVNCQTSERQSTMTPRQIQSALGSVIQVRYSSRR